MEDEDPLNSIFLIPNARTLMTRVHRTNTATEQMASGTARSEYIQGLIWNKGEEVDQLPQREEGKGGLCPHLCPPGVRI